MYNQRIGNNKAREARGVADKLSEPEPAPTLTPRQQGRLAFKERQLAERLRAAKTWDQMSMRGNRNGHPDLPRGYARAEARYAERAARAGTAARSGLHADVPALATSIDNLADEAEYESTPHEVDLLDIMQPARGKVARGFVSERARHPDTIPYPLLAPGSTLSLDDYLLGDIPAELIAELFPAEEIAIRPPVDVDSDRTDEEDGNDAADDAVIGDEEDEQWEIATVGVSEFSFVSVGAG